MRKFIKNIINQHAPSCRLSTVKNQSSHLVDAEITRCMKRVLLSSNHFHVYLMTMVVVGEAFSNMVMREGNSKVKVGCSPLLWCPSSELWRYLCISFSSEHVKMYFDLLYLQYLAEFYSRYFTVTFTKVLCCEPSFLCWNRLQTLSIKYEHIVSFEIIPTQSYLIAM